MHKTKKNVSMNVVLFRAYAMLTLTPTNRPSVAHTIFMLDSNAHKPPKPGAPTVLMLEIKNAHKPPKTVASTVMLE